MSNDTNEAAGDVPAIPNDDELRKEVIAGLGSVERTPMGDRPGRSQADVDKLDEVARARLRDAILIQGPGTMASPAQVAQWELRVEADQKMKRLGELERSYNEVARDGRLAHSEDAREAMIREAEKLKADLEAITGEPGRRRVEQAIEKSIGARRRLYETRRLHVLADRRATALAEQAEIERLARIRLAAKGLGPDGHDPVRRG